MRLEDREIIAEFVVESREHLAEIENQILAIEAGGSAVDTELVNQVFRAVHSIKGAAGFFGCGVVEQLAHELETVLNSVRNRQLVPNARLTDVLLRAGDRLRGLIEDLENSETADVKALLAELRAVTRAEPAGPLGDASSARPEAAQEEPHRTETNLNRIDGLVRLASEGDTPAHPLDKDTSSQAAQPAVERSDDSTQKRSGNPADAKIRVSVRILDHLMNLAGELVLSRNQLLQTVAAEQQGILDSVAARLDQVTSEIQEAIMQTRLQVVDTVFNKFPRIVRDLSNSLGKQCTLTVEGEDVELDKSVIEAIGDPLTHLIRNAIDHGIESPDVRARAGKPSRGRIALKAFHQAGKVHITVSDDGAGIDVERLKAKAVSQGIWTAEQARQMRDSEAIRLIFRPGFSTAEKITNLSGRGVGMDVVHANIERLGGKVEVNTELGRGTQISISLPLTLAIIPSLVVGCHSRRFAIPQASISELVRIKASEVSARIERMRDAEVFRLRGDLLPLVRLATVLRLPRAHRAEPGRDSAVVNIIVLDTGRMRYGLIVDRLHDSEEIVVKPLGQHLKGCSCFAGATILGDGCVALILDTGGIAASAGLNASCLKGSHEHSRNRSHGQDLQNLLLFRNGQDEQFAIPMELVARLERLRADQIDTVGGQKVLQYRGASLPVLSLEDHIQAAPRAAQQRLYVAVFRVLEREVGLVVPEILDIRALPAEIDAVTFRQPGVSGSLVWEGHTVRLLDLFELTQAARPQWFEDRDVRSHEPKDSRSKILLAEDSDFFRRQLAGFLEAEGYEVCACEDGEVAWQALKRPGQRFDLLVTDLEMPRMDGFELAHKIKSTPEWAHLPVIAVTSLASDEAIARGQDAGVDDYLIKLDRERLAAAVRVHLSAAAASGAGATHPFPTR